MAKYGYAYQGSKSKIADSLMEILPAGNRFVDLFGGGGAMSHCAALSGKFQKVLYNDLNPLAGQLFKNAVNGMYDEKVFTPHFVERSEFFDKKNQDGYIKYLWSFSSNGEDYVYGRNKEAEKHDIHNYVVYGEYSNIFDNVIPPDSRSLTGDTIYERWRDLKKKTKGFDTRHNGLERHFALNKLQEIGSFPIEYTQSSYSEYTYEDGDVVYCDPPYQNARKYLNNDFDSETFYDWVYEQNYPIWFSSYDISDDRFECVFEINKLCTFSASSNSLVRTEKLYYHNPDKEKSE